MSILIFLFLSLVSCKKVENGSKIPGLPLPGDEESNIHPEKDEVYFGPKGDTIIVNTENPYMELYLTTSEGDGIYPTNYTKDTLTDTWTKLIALEPIKYPCENGDISISSKKVKIIVFDNNTGLDRSRGMLLGKGNSGAIINITQTAK